MNRAFTSIAASFVLLTAPACLASTTIPIEIVEGNNIADLKIGDITLKAHIDTGGYKALGLSATALSKVRVQFTGTLTTRTDGAGGKFEGREFIVPELRLGDTIFRNVRGYERFNAAKGDFGGTPFDALVGRDFLKPYTVVVDYPMRRIELHKPSAASRVCGVPTARVTQSRQGFYVSNVMTDHGPLSLAWDTGSRGASFVQESIAKQRALPLKDDAYLTQKFVIGARDLGPIELVPLPLNGVPDIDGMIGISVFAFHRVCFDFGGGTVSLQ